MGKWTQAATQVQRDTRDAVQTILDALNKGQRQKLLKNPQVPAVLARLNLTVE